MIVLKFGGSSVGTPERIQSIVKILKSYYSEGKKFTVVFSAFGGVTDSLIQMSRLAENGDESYKEAFKEFEDRHNKAIKELMGDQADLVIEKANENHQVLSNLLYGIFLVREASTRTMDYVLSFGERNSAFIISQVLQKNGIPADFLDARRVIKTNKNFGAAKVDFALSYQNISEHYRNHPNIQIVTGFISSAKGGLTTTLGRGGSDYTASILAAGLNAQSIEIWTDVDGVLTADPRIVNKAFTIESMTYAEAMEMSHFGAKVIYPPTLVPALQKRIPLYIKNTFNPEFKGTLVSDYKNDKGNPIKGISSINDVALLTLQGSGLFGVPGIAGRLFSSLARAGINIILITQGSSEHSISFAIQPKLAKHAKRKVEEEFEFEISAKSVEPIKVEEDLSVIAAIGENMRYHPGIAGRLFQALGKNGINCVAIAQGSSELNVSVVINKSDESKALNALHEAFFLSDTQELHVFMVGVGLIGSTLLEQIEKQSSFLLEKRSLEIKVVGLANSKKMLLNANGIPFSGWKENLIESGETTNMAQFVERMNQMNLPNSIFVDNTANAEITSFYESILSASISISTPNKIATSSSYLQYERLKNIASNRGVQFRYETNVGAGLPIISTITDLIDSGDQIQRIEGVLSGSLSFIFNTFEIGKSFSDIVRLAKEKGYTEPDPRVDLNGVDVRRKLVILAREAGLPLEAEDVEIIPLLPEACRSASTVDSFFDELEKANDYFSEMLSKVEANNEKLKMIASLENGKAKIGLQSVNSDHPFYSLSGSDNMIVFTTSRYTDRPLVVRGPGAGAEVTAAGVFAEIISIGHYLS